MHTNFLREMENFYARMSPDASFDYTPSQRATTKLFLKILGWKQGISKQDIFKRPIFNVLPLYVILEFFAQ